MSDRVYILMREYVSHTGRVFDPDIVDIFRNKTDANMIADSKNKKSNKYRFFIKVKVLK